MSLAAQSREIWTLDEFLAEASEGRIQNVAALDIELAMAAVVFDLMQQIYTNTPLSDRTYSKVVGSLLAGMTRYYATSVDLCLRGHTAEAHAVLRSSVEHAAYLVRIVDTPTLAEAWVELADLTKKQKHELFGSEFELMHQPIIKETAASLYNLLSIFGVHTRIAAIEQTIDFQHPFGWRIRSTDVGSPHVRLFLLGIVFSMRDLVLLGLVPKLLEAPLPKEIAVNEARFTALHAKLNEQRQDFRTWLSNPERPKAILRVAGVKTIVVDSRR